jgi:RNA polymerase sigma factor (sigma-70 family)
MTGASSRGVWKQLDELFCFGASGQLGDDELLGRFVAGRRDEAAEAAFAALVERHGPMVLGVCRRVLGDRHEAEDAFQATFLVLARKAGAIARREQLANWLHGVASRTALDARARANRRRAREHRAFSGAAAGIRPDDGPERGELRAVLDEELARLPASYRGAVVLCELDGLSRQAAARRLGIPEGTLSSRLARAKDLLRHRLTRRGLAPSAMALEAALSHEARALILPPSLAGSTIQAAARVAAGASLAEAVSASVVTLTQGALNAMILAKFKGLALGLAAAAVVTAGVGVLAQGPATGPSDDRLGAVERKLDRILEALGSPHGDVAEQPKSRNVGGRTTTTSSDLVPPPAITWSTSDARKTGGAVSIGAGSASSGSRPIEARVADLERRFADLERRFAAMERRFTNGRQSDWAPRGPGLPAAKGAPSPDQPGLGAPSPDQPGLPAAKAAYPFEAPATDPAAAVEPARPF